MDWLLHDREILIFTSLGLFLWCFSELLGALNKIHAELILNREQLESMELKAVVPAYDDNDY